MTPRIKGTLAQILQDAENLKWDGAVMLPSEGKWKSNSSCVVFGIDDFEEEEMTIDGQVFCLAVDVQQLQSVVRNAHAQGMHDIDGLFRALMHYYDNDSFISASTKR